MVTDPLTLDYAESREDSIRIGYHGRGPYGSVYLFNGDVNKAGGDDTLDNFGATVGYILDNESLSLDIGVGYINSLAESNGNQETIPIAGEVSGYTPGISVHGVLNSGPFTVVGEYISASSSFNQSNLEFNGKGAKPVAYNFELGYGFKMMGMDSTLAVAHQRSREALGLGLIETRNMVTFRSVILKKTELSFEYSQAYDYSTADSDGSVSGSDEKASTFTLQLAVGF